MTTTQYRGIVGFLRACELMRKKCKGMPRYSMDGLLLKHGQLWPWRKCDPKQFKWKGLGECYMNAANLAMLGKGHTYCEGMAAIAFPVQHAWCIDREGFVVDPTWDSVRSYNNDSRREYFGVTVQTAFLREMIVKTGRWCGVIDVPPDYPIFTRPVRHWKERVKAPAVKIKRNGKARTWEFAPFVEGLREDR